MMCDKDGDRSLLSMHLDRMFNARFANHDLGRLDRQPKMLVCNLICYISVSAVVWGLESICGHLCAIRA